MSAYAYKGDLVNAEKWFNKISENNKVPTANTYNLLLECCSNMKIISENDEDGNVYSFLNLMSLSRHDKIVFAELKFEIRVMKFVLEMCVLKLWLKGVCVQTVFEMCVWVCVCFKAALEMCVLKLHLKCVCWNCTQNGLLHYNQFQIE